MVNAQHIRIGNWLYSKLTNRKFQTTAEDIVELNADPFTCEYVPLTPEVLEAAGFQWETSQRTHLQYKADADMYIGFYFEIDVMKQTQINQNDDAFGLGLINLNPLPYVHQLQNLYHALTGEELSIS